MCSCWKPIWEETLIGYGQGYQFVGCDGGLDCGGVDRYNEEGYGRASVWFVVFDQ